MTTLRVRSSSRESGFTLIELLVTLGVVGLIMGLAINQVGKMTGKNMKAQARKFASTIRFLYNKSMADGVVLRLAFDFEENRYWVEKTSERFTLTREEEKKDKKKDDKEEDEKSPFSITESFVLKPVKLQRGVYFKDVYAEHQAGPLSEGKAYLYFFPQGYVERSVINLRDKNDELHYSLEINPISGDVKIAKEYKEPEEE